MTHTCTSGTCFLSIFMGLGWLALSAALLWQTWNKVIAAQVKVKAVKFWQALLLVATISVFCFPKMMMHRGHGGCGKGGCSMHSGFGMHSGCCKHHCDEEGEGDHGDRKEKCPYSKQHDEGKADSKAAE